MIPDTSVRVRCGAWAAVLFVSALPVSLGCAPAPASPGPFHGWSTLRMKASAGPLFSGQFEMHLAREGDRRRLETRSSARFLGMVVGRSRTTSLLDGTSHPIEHVTLSRKRGRRYVFAERSYEVEKFESPEGPDGPQERWASLSKKDYPYPVVGENGAPLQPFDYYAMLLRLRDEKLDRPGDEVQLPVATSRGAVTYRVTVSELRSNERSYRRIATGEKKTVKTREMRLRIAPSDPEQADEGFMNMEGETEIWVDARSKTLLEIRGKVPGVAGTVVVTLSELD